jgi:protein-tyrosine phosphatase
MLLKKGITADISLEYSRVDIPLGVDYYLWLPTKDHFPPPKERLLTGALFLKHLADKKVKTYIHCRFGHGRAPTLVAAYLILTGMTPTEAIAVIKKKRPVVHLTDRQLKALQKFYKKYGQ